MTATDLLWLAATTWGLAAGVAGCVYAVIGATVWVITRRGDHR